MNRASDARPEPELTNPRAERVRSVRALAGRSARRRSGRFLVEGPQSVREALATSAAGVHEVYLTPEAARRYPEIAAAATSRGCPARLCTAEVLAAMSPDAQGVLVVAEVLHAGWDDLSAPALVVVLAHVRDPGNAGTVLRAADAFGADAVVVTDSSVDVHNPKAVRSTAGSLFHLPVLQDVPLAEAAGRLRAAGLTVLAADGAGEHELDDLLERAGIADPAEPDLTRPTAWVFGNEAWGLRAQDLELVDASVRIGLRGRAESLNLATAAAVCLHASAHAQRSAATPRR